MRVHSLETRINPLGLTIRPSFRERSGEDGHGVSHASIEIRAHSYPRVDFRNSTVNLKSLTRSEQTRSRFQHPVCRKNNSNGKHHHGSKSPRQDPSFADPLTFTSSLLPNPNPPTIKISTSQEKKESRVTKVISPFRSD